MKNLKFRLLILLVICFLKIDISLAEDFNWVEKRKEFNFNFTTQSGDKLIVDNQFGEVKVVLWSKNMVKATINVIANAPNNNMLETFIGTVNVNGHKMGNQISLVTQIEKESLSFKSLHKDKNTNLKIDYLVYIPTNLSLLTIKNNFGKVILPDLDFPVSLNLNYCDLIADNIFNQNNNLNLNFGSAQINSLKGGELNSNYTKINLKEIKNVVLKNNNGVLNADFIEDIDGILNYSQGVFGQVKDALKLKLNYTNNLKIEKIDSKIKNLEILSNYSNVNLPVSNSFNGEFDIKTNYGKFYFDPNLNIHFIKNTETEKSKFPKTSNYYQGKIGKESPTKSKIILISNFGDIKIK